MTLEEATAINAQLVRNRFAILMGEEYVPLPDCSLEEMLQATRMVREAGPERQEDGKTRRYATVDPRGIAASYAFEKYGRNPGNLLEALGFEFIPDAEAAKESTE